VTLGISNALTSGVAKIFHPIVYAVAWMLAFIYGLIPNYAIAIAILTVLIMAILTPLTVKSTRSMLAMQKLQPELKKLQQKYKGPEHRTELNEEMMRLYREEGVNPATGCITGLLQAPFLFILYSVIRGLSNTVLVKGVLVSEPKNIPHSSTMYYDLTHATPPGAMLVWHMNIALKPISPHGSFLAAIPFYVLIAIAVGVQFFQMSALNRRNPNASQMSSQMLMFQRFTPILFAYIYFIVPAAAVIYMIFSSLIRILTQDLIFRYDKPKAAKERSVPGSNPTIGTGSDAKSDANDDGEVTPPPAAAKNGSAASPQSQAKPAAKAPAPEPKPAPLHPRAKDKKKRKAR
jgi:YidC/Oxa1 family membrane protein insertase